jgi:hypothetical protein
VVSPGELFEHSGALAHHVGALLRQDFVEPILLPPLADVDEVLLHGRDKVHRLRHSDVGVGRLAEEKLLIAVLLPVEPVPLRYVDRQVAQGIDDWVFWVS